MAYPPTAGSYKTANGATASLNRLQYVDTYTEDLLFDSHGYPTQQHRVSKLTIRYLKKIFPSLLGEVKKYARPKKVWAGFGDWATIKEILGWVIETHLGNLTLYSKLHIELSYLMEIPNIQVCISVNKMKRLIGKLRSMHLDVPGDIGHFYAMQVSLTRSQAEKRPAANLSVLFHQEIKF